MQKDATEQDILRINAHQADIAMRQAWDIIKPGLTEENIALAIQNSFSDQGALPQFSSLHQVQTVRSAPSNGIAKIKRR